MIFLELGVSLRKLTPALNKALTVINAIFQSHDQDCTITSGDDGDHSAGSLHYSGDAVDIRLPAAPIIEILCYQLRTALGKDYDLILEPDHIHIEYDPK